MLDKKRVVSHRAPLEPAPTFNIHSMTTLDDLLTTSRYEKKHEDHYRYNLVHAQNDLLPVLVNPYMRNGGELDAKPDVEELGTPSSWYTCQEVSNRILPPTNWDVVKLSNFEPLYVIGRGSFGMVYLVEFHPGVESNQELVHPQLLSLQGLMSSVKYLMFGMPKRHVPPSESVGPRKDRKLYAMKVLSKSMIQEKRQAVNTKSERIALAMLNHPFVVKLYHAVQTPRHLYLMVDYCRGGDLYHHMIRRGPLQESEARFYAAQLLLALEYVHSKGILYRDLKPENILICSDGYLKLTDFGLCRLESHGNFCAQSVCGTPEYLAPEVFGQSGYGHAVDWWSFAIVIYEMVVGSLPFYNPKRSQLFENIVKGDLKYPPIMSGTLVDLLKRFFVKDPRNRLGHNRNDTQEIREHPWFRGMDWQKLYDKALEPPYVPRVSSPTDVQNFDEQFVCSRIKLDSVQGPEFKASSESSEAYTEGITCDFMYQDSTFGNWYYDARYAKEVQ